MNLDKPVWEQDPEDAEKEIWALCESMYNAQREVMLGRCEDYTALYEGFQALGLGAYTVRLPAADLPSFNVVQAGIDTLASRILQTKVRPYFLTEKGKYQLQVKAKGMNRLVEAEFIAAGIYGELGNDWFMDGASWGDGLIKIGPDYENNRPQVDRVFKWEVFVGENDAQKGRPRQMVYMPTVDRALLMNQFRGDDKAVELIKDAQRLVFDNQNNSDFMDPDEVRDRIRIAEYWHLPSGRVDRTKPEAWGYNEGGKEVRANHDGRHLILTENGALLDEPWPWDYFPIVRFQFARKRLGYWGRGVPETLLGVQLAINRMMQRVDGIMNLHARPLIYVNRRAKINTDKITNSWANIIEGNEPAASAMNYITPQSVPAEYIAQIERLKEWAFDAIGVSQMAAAGEKPPGIEAAVALQQMDDIQSVRFSDIHNRWEQAHIQAARVMVDTVRMLAERNGDNYKVIWGDAEDMEEINWKDVDLDDSQFHLHVWPTNLLPQTPAAKTQRVIDLINADLMSREEGRARLDYPDMPRDNARRNIERKIDLIVSKGRKDIVPDAYMNLPLAHIIAVDRLNGLEADGMSEDPKTDLLRRFIEDVQDEILRAAAASAAQQAPQQGAPPPLPPGMPGAPPPQPLAGGTPQQPLLAAPPSGQPNNEAA